MTASRSIGAVVLAAGAGTRLGGVAKALLTIEGRTFLERIVTTGGAGEGTIVVVGPPFEDAVAAHARELGARVVRNPDPARGMASSIALGFAALEGMCSEPIFAVHVHLSGAWLWPVDHPFVRADTLDRIVRGVGTEIEQTAGQPRFGDRGGHPPLVGRKLWPELARCDQIEGGARTVLRPHMIAIEVDDPGVVRDVDTPADVRAS
jgi:molybdenum cofactor cytidylyltransferase